MPNPGLEKPVTRVTLNLWASDVVYMKRVLGPGWQAILRDAVQAYVRRLKEKPPQLWSAYDERY